MASWNIVVSLGFLLLLLTFTRTHKDGGNSFLISIMFLFENITVIKMTYRHFGWKQNQHSYSFLISQIFMASWVFKRISWLENHSWKWHIYWICVKLLAIILCFSFQSNWSAPWHGKTHYMSVVKWYFYLVNPTITTYGI